MPRRFDRIDGLLLTAMLLCGVAAVYCYWPDSPPYEIVEADKHFVDLPINRAVYYSYVVRNRTNKPIRIIGAEFT